MLCLKVHWTSYSRVFWLSLYKVEITVCLFVLFVCPIITQEPHDRFGLSFVWGTRENHRNIFKLGFKILSWVSRLLQGKIAKIVIKDQAGVTILFWTILDNFLFILIYICAAQSHRLKPIWKKNPDHVSQVCVSATFLIFKNSWIFIQSNLIYTEPRKGADLNQQRWVPKLV